MRDRVRTLRRALQRARFRLWALRLHLRLRRNGSRLILDCPHGGRFEGRPPVVEVPLTGDTASSHSTLTLRLGRAASLGRGLILEVHPHGHALLELGDSTWLGAGCRVQLQGGTVRIGRETQVHDLCLLKARGEIEIGDRVRVSRGAILQAERRIAVGDLAGLGERTSLVDSDHVHDGSDAPFWEQGLRSAPIEIGRNAWVGANAVVLRGARLGANAVVAAGSVLTAGDHQGGWLHAGAPARPVRPLAEDDPSRSEG